MKKINALRNHPRSQVRDFFDPGESIFVTRAPGRLDVMGGIADYSGSLVLELPISEAIFAALQLDSSRTITVITLSEHVGHEMLFQMPFEQFEDDGRPVSYELARRTFNQCPSRAWAAYVAGVFLVLMRERGVVFEKGARILIDSNVPEGKGVSSSAALEVATMSAVAAGFEILLDSVELASLCQKVENLVVGAPCGIMDQITVSCGERGHLLALLCQPANLINMISIPGNLEVWGLDSGVRHSVSGNPYGDVRAAAFMGYRMIAEIDGLSVSENATEGSVRVEDQPRRGYLANVSPEEFENSYANHLPERMSGAEFLSRYKGITDPVSRIDPGRDYSVKASTAHPIFENSRVRRFSDLMAQRPSSDRLELMGELMYQSHASYSACGLGSEATDLLVELVREAGSRRGLYGARITGGGSGGTVAVLGECEAVAAINGIVERYEQKTGYRPYVFSGSSPGSAAFGVLKLTPE
ncbi:MAG TPA: GHMP kinase [Blastocatellia bacterium]|nr:GHMP kinase [Blastocatellia bacterium]